MAVLRLPVDDWMVGFEIPPDRLCLLARYLTASCGKDRRVGTFIKDPKKYGVGILNRRLRDLDDRFAEAFEEMDDQIRRWLRRAEHDAPGDEPDTEEILSHMILGPKVGSGMELTSSQLRDMNLGCRALIGHRPDNQSQCEICSAFRAHQWMDVLSLTETPPELVREFYRNLMAAGYPALPAPHRQVEVETDPDSF